MVKRAITLGGGGPAAGLHIGVLEALEAHPEIEFQVWSLSCIGAWVGIVYNQFSDEVEDKKGEDKKAENKKAENKKIKNKHRAEQTYQFFKNGVFRDDESYERFPINRVFGPDWRNNIKALNNFVANRDNYNDFRWDPYRMMDVFQGSMELLFDRLPDTSQKMKFKRIDDGDINSWILNEAMATNPFVRYFTSMMYLSDINGLSKINYPDSEFMKDINFEELKKDGKPHIFHNAWNLDEKKLALFSNREMENKLEGKEYNVPISASSLCACSALPFIEGTVEIDGVTYCEGALVDTVNFESLLEEHPDLDEIWVSRIVDSKQIRKPVNLHDALANLCQLFAATVGEDDVKLFKYRVQLDKAKRRNLTIVEIRVPGHINFNWNHSNLENARELGKAVGKQAIKAYYEHAQLKKHAGPHFINDNPEKDDKEGWKKLLDKHDECVKRAAVRSRGKAA
jgi:predicted acylesterase/phospholipase RssA